MPLPDIPPKAAKALSINETMDGMTGCLLGLFPDAPRSIAGHLYSDFDFHRTAFHITVDALTFGPHTLHWTHIERVELTGTTLAIHGYEGDVLRFRPHSGYHPEALRWVVGYLNAQLPHHVPAKIPEDTTQMPDIPPIVAKILSKNESIDGITGRLLGRFLNVPRSKRRLLAEFRSPWEDFQMTVDALTFGPHTLYWTQIERVELTGTTLAFHGYEGDVLRFRAHSGYHPEALRWVVGRLNAQLQPYVPATIPEALLHLRSAEEANE